MPSVERTVSCPECGTERSTRAGTGTTLKCSKGHVFRAPAPVADASPPPAAPARVKRAKAGETVVRQNARPRPKKASPPAGPEGKPATPALEPTPPAATPPPVPSGGADGAGGGTPAANPPGGDPDQQREFGRRGGLARYQRLVRKAS